MEELKKKKIWFLWKKEKRRGSMTKVPKSITGRNTGATSEFSDQWVTFVEAEEANLKIGADGVGFAIPKGYVFIDIDHIDTNEALFKLLVSRFDSYTEISPSGNGAHIIARCSYEAIPLEPDSNCPERMKLASEYYQKNSKRGLEVYVGGTTGRYATYTGNVFDDKDSIKDATKALLTTLNHEMLKPYARKKGTAAVQRESGDAFDVICSLKKQANSEKFLRLFDEGDFSEYGSHSEADLALCTLIAFRAGPSPELIDTIFRQSALYREKWERDDYREQTISMGIMACNGNFHKSLMPHPPFVVFTDRGTIIDPIKLAQYIRQNLKYILVRDNGRQSIQVYVYEKGVYSYFADDMLVGVIKQFIAAYDEQLVDLRVVHTAIEHIKTDRVYVSERALNANESVINFRNGLLYVSANSLELKEHSPDVLSTVQLPCDWLGDESATPEFDRYVQKLTNEDSDAIKLILQSLGVVISNIKGWRMKKSLFMQGPGDSGKSLIRKLAEYLVGLGNYIGIDLDSIEERFGTGAIYGKRLVGTADMAFMRVKELKTFKRLTGGDSVFAEFKGQQPFEYVFNGFLWFCMNRLPRFGGDDGKWVYDRIMVVDCPNSIPREQQDKFMFEKLCRECPGIVYKAVKALQEVIQNGYDFTEGTAQKAARERYRNENSTVVAFFKECMCKWPEGKIGGNATTSRIYRIYRAWCDENNRGYSKTSREFRDEISDYLGAAFSTITVHRNKGTYFREYTLCNEVKELYARAYGYEDFE